NLGHHVRKHIAREPIGLCYLYRLQFGFHHQRQLREGLGSAITNPPFFIREQRYQPWLVLRLSNTTECRSSLDAHSPILVRQTITHNRQVFSAFKKAQTGRQKLGINRRLPHGYHPWESLTCIST